MSKRVTSQIGKSLWKKKKDSKEREECIRNGTVRTSRRATAGKTSGATAVAIKLAVEEARRCNTVLEVLIHTFGYVYCSGGLENWAYKKRENSDIVFHDAAEAAAYHDAILKGSLETLWGT